MNDGGAVNVGCVHVISSPQVRVQSLQRQLRIPSRKKPRCPINVLYRIGSSRGLASGLWSSRAFFSCFPDLDNTYSNDSASLRKEVSLAAHRAMLWRFHLPSRFLALHYELSSPASFFVIGLTLVSVNNALQTGDPHLQPSQCTIEQYEASVI